MFPLSQQEFQEALKRLSIIDLPTATIRQVCSLAAEIEKVAGQRMVHLEMGNPGLEAERVGIAAEVAALERGIANQYPNIAGIPALKKAGKDFVKAFLDVDIPEKCVVPTVGSMQGTFTLMLLLKRRLEGKDTMLFVDPGFPAQHNQAKLLGFNVESFDIYDYRGEKLKAKLESILSKGNITSMIYSNPNTPAWTSLTEQELEVIGRMATKYDCIVLEDLAYLGMDFRKDISEPYCKPFVSTVAKYTDNYILLVSGSKIFSYAGQRISIVCMSQQVYDRRYETFERFFEMPAFGDAYIYGVLYCCSSGTAHSAQHALAAMMEKAVKGELNFVNNCRDYERRSARAKKIFLDNGFHIVYSKDGDRDISDGFFFTIGYGDMSGEELQAELLRYGVASIALRSTGSKQPGVRICISMLHCDEEFNLLEQNLERFNSDHRKV